MINILLLRNKINQKYIYINYDGSIRYSKEDMTKPMLDEDKVLDKLDLVPCPNTLLYVSKSHFFIKKNK